MICGHDLSSTAGLHFPQIVVDKEGLWNVMLMLVAKLEKMTWEDETEYDPKIRGPHKLIRGQTSILRAGVSINNQALTSSLIQRVSKGFVLLSKPSFSLRRVTLRRCRLRS